MVTVELEVEIELSDTEKETMNEIKKVLIKAAELEKLPPVSVTIMIVDNEQIQTFNRKYRQKDVPTDVLSFPLYENIEEWVKEDWEDSVQLGDIIISLPKAREQAIDYGHSLKREILFLAVHGFLHLIGYDHETKEEEEEMFALQEQVLSQLGISR